MLLDKLLWQAPGALYAGTLPVRASSFSFDCEKSALAAAGTPEHGPYCMSLGGTWKIRRNLLMMIGMRIVQSGEI